MKQREGESILEEKLGKRVSLVFGTRSRRWLKSFIGDSAIKTNALREGGGNERKNKEGKKGDRRVRWQKRSIEAYGERARVWERGRDVETSKRKGWRVAGEKQTRGQLEAGARELSR